MLPPAIPTNEAVDVERKRLFKIIVDLVVWELTRQAAAIHDTRGDLQGLLEL